MVGRLEVNEEVLWLLKRSRSGNTWRLEAGGSICPAVRSLEHNRSQKSETRKSYLRGSRAPEGPTGHHQRSQVAQSGRIRSSPERRVETANLRVVCPSSRSVYVHEDSFYCKVSLIILYDGCEVSWVNHLESGPPAAVSRHQVRLTTISPESR